MVRPALQRSPAKSNFAPLIQVTWANPYKHDIGPDIAWLGLLRVMNSLIRDRSI